MSNLTLPTIHLNGSDSRTLLNEYEAAHSAVLVAMDALSHINLNARDYYTQGVGAFEKAREEMLARYKALENVANEITAIMESIHFGNA